MSLLSYRKPMLLAALLGGCVFAAVPAAHAQLSFTYTLFDPPGTSQDVNAANYGSIVYGVSASGLAAGVYVTSDVVERGYIRNADGTYKTTSINFTGGTGTVNTELSGINDAGYVTGVGVDANFNVTQGFIYNYNTNSFITPVYNGAYRTLFNNVTESGLVATVAFATQADYDNGTNVLNAIYNIGTGQFTAVSGLSGFETNTFIQTATANGYLANGADANNNGPGAFVNTTTGTTTFFNVPGAVRTRTNSINAAETQVRGNYIDAFGVRHAFLYDIPSNRYYTTDPPSNASNPVVYSATYASNSNTTFGGAYQLQDGTFHSLLVTTSAAPEPSALALVLPALPLTALALRRRRASKNVC